MAMAATVSTAGDGGNAGLFGNGGNGGNGLDAVYDPVTGARLSAATAGGMVATRPCSAEGVLAASAVSIPTGLIFQPARRW